MRISTRLVFLPLIAGLFLGFQSPAAADTSSEAVSTMSWVADQTNPDGTVSSFEDFPDLKLTLDAVFGGIAAGIPEATTAAWLTAVEQASSPGFIDMVIDESTGAARDNGLIGKALISLSALGKAPTSFAGINPQQLATDSFTDNELPGHSAGTNAFGQAYVMIGLARTGTLPADTVSFLSEQQCADGGFPLDFSADPARHCGAGTVIPETDATAMIIMALRAAEAEGISAAQAPREKAVVWLKSQQKEDGAFAGHPEFSPTSNTNSSGLAAAALSGIEPATVDRVAAWAKQLQLTAGKDSGALAYDQAAHGKASGGEISPIARGTWVRASAQGVFAFAPVDLYHLGEQPFERSVPYTLAGEHTVNGHLWKTTCAPYSQTERCHTHIWATTVEIRNGRFIRSTGWVFNNLTEVS